MTLRRLALLALALFVVSLLYNAFNRWGLENSHRRFLAAIEDKDWPEVGELVSENYSDRFGFDAKDLSAAVRDVAEQFILSMTIEWTPLERGDTSDGAVILTGNIALSGSSPNPIAAQIVREAARFKEKPVLFTWRKESRWPWSWRLISVDLPGLDVPGGYEPGNFSFESLDF